MKALEQDDKLDMTELKWTSSSALFYDGELLQGCIAILQRPFVNSYQYIMLLKFCVCEVVISIWTM